MRRTGLDEEQFRRLQLERTSDAVMLVSMSEHNDRENNPPKASTSGGEKNVGSPGGDTSDAVMLVSMSEPNETSKNDGSTVDASTSKIGGTVDVSTSSVDKITEPFLRDMSSEEENIRSNRELSTSVCDEDDPDETDNENSDFDENKLEMEEFYFCQIAEDNDHGGKAYGEKAHDEEERGK